MELETWTLGDTLTIAIAFIGLVITVLFNYAKANDHQIKKVNGWLARIVVVAWFVGIITFSLLGLVDFMQTEGGATRHEIGLFVAQTINLIIWAALGITRLGEAIGRRSVKRRLTDL